MSIKHSVVKKERKAEHFLPKPVYPGGPKKMSTFIYKNLVYPKEVINDQVKGTVRLKIEIDYQGKVISSQVLYGLHPLCDDEARRVAGLLQFEVNNKLRKGKIRYHKTLNIKFVPPRPKATKTQIQYKIIKEKKGRDQKPKPKSYSYTIKF